MIEGSGSIPLTHGSGSGSMRPKNTGREENRMVLVVKMMEKDMEKGERGAKRRQRRNNVQKTSTDSHFCKDIVLLVWWRQGEILKRGIVSSPHLTQ
jgi:hypothetical protein